MSFLSFFWPQVLEKVESPISGEIKVIEQFGKRWLEIGGMTQSGGIVEEIWKRGIKKISNFQISSEIKLRLFPISNCLILGLGAGTVAKIISNIQISSEIKFRLYLISNIKIVGVEIDPEVVRLGKKYFGLGEIENLEIVIDDAVKYVDKHFKRFKRLKQFKRFDLILVDLYQGREVPKSCTSKRFLEGLKRIKGEKGMVVFNRLYSRDKREETDKFVQKCREVFGEVETKKAVCNLMVYCR